MNSTDVLLPRKIIYALFGAATVVYFIGLFIPVMEVDAAQYAAIGREMMESGNYLEVTNRGQDYLDKPPLLFWLSAVFFKLFGVNVVAYKLPSYLFSLLGVYSAFRMAKHLYDEETGVMAALILYTTQAFFLFNNDVRTDTLLTANAIFATWQLVMFVDSQKWKHLLLASLGVALAMLAKGPIGAIVPAAALVTHLVLTRNLKMLFTWKWMVALAAVLVLLLPMVVGLYNQYGAEGPRFFFWTQSFGRITGENAWKNDAGYFYFLHVFGWSMLPWTLIAATAFFYSIVRLFRKDLAPGFRREYYTVGGFVLPFVALSLSQYKLPHYIFVVYPFAAMLSAVFLRQVVLPSRRWLTVFRICQAVIIAGILAFCVVIGTVWFATHNILLWSVFAAGVTGCVWWWIRSSASPVHLVFASALAAISVNWVLNMHAYPSLFRYEPGKQLSPYVPQEHLQKKEVYFYHYGSYALEFYTQTIFGYLSEDDLAGKLAAGISFSVVGGEDLKAAIEKNGWRPKQTHAADHFHITTLTLQFLNPGTREQTVDKVYLFEF